MRNLLLTGGPSSHDFPATAKALAGILGDAGIDSDVTDDIEGGLAALAGGAYGLVTVNALRWRMAGDKYTAERPRWGFSLSASGREALTGHLAGGGSLLAVHTAAICFDDWPQWGDVVGAAWVWGESRHPALGPVHVSVGGDDAHPIVAGLGDFDVVDEVYAFMDVRPDVTPLATAVHDGVAHPLLWARPFGAGRVVYDALGHDERSLAQPVHRTILRRAARWLVEVPCAA